jgi:Domain of unknown function (DUF4373)
MKRKAFKHPSNLRNDIKVIAMRSKYGSAGYGRYLAILEMLANHDNKVRFSSLLVTLLAHQLLMTYDEAGLFIKDIISEYDLLQINNDIISCNWLEIYEIEVHN